MRKKKAKSRARVCLFVPICAIAIVAIFTAVGNYWVQIFEKYQEKDILEEKMLTLREKEAELKVDVEKLEDPDYIARSPSLRYWQS